MGPGGICQRRPFARTEIFLLHNMYGYGIFSISKINALIGKSTRKIPRQRERAAGCKRVSREAWGSAPVSRPPEMGKYGGTWARVKGGGGFSPQSEKLKWNRGTPPSSGLFGRMGAFSFGETPVMIERGRSS